jgi:hypothetical protein
MFIGTKVADFTISQRQRVSPTMEIEEILEGEIYNETSATSKMARENINDTYKKFAQKYGIKTTETTAAAAKKRGKK